MKEYQFRIMELDEFVDPNMDPAMEEGFLIGFRSRLIAYQMALELPNGIPSLSQVSLIISHEVLSMILFELEKVIALIVVPPARASFAS